MILQSLKEYADRKGNALGSPGYEMRGIPFLIVIDRNGGFIDLQDTREKQGKKLKAHEYEVPQSTGRSGKDSWKTTFVLWDHYGYVLGFAPPDETKTSTQKQHHVFVEMIRKVHKQCPNDPGVNAVLRFLEVAQFSKVFSHPSWPECEKIKGCNLTFKLAGETDLVCQSSHVRAHVSTPIPDAGTEEEAANGPCLITGEYSPLMRLHPAIALPGLKKPAPLCAINDGESPAFSSFGKSQGYNFPVSKIAASDYGKALNSLLKSSHQHLRLNDVSMVFWAAKEVPLETQFLDFFREPPEDKPDGQVNAVRALYNSIESGAYVESDDLTRFYSLGLSPNAARIAIRFWIVDTVKGMAGKICQHFTDTRIVHGPRDKDALPLFRLLVSIATQGKADNIPPNVAGDAMRAILEGLPYPQTLLQAAIRRIRAEHEVTYPRAALIKACINRSTRYDNSTKERELAVSLDESNTNIGYRLGRLFATLERIQIRAHTSGGGKEPNSTIRDRYYGSASATPNTVFSTLVRLSKHHLSKIEYVGERVNFERLIGEIMDGIPPYFPGHLSLDDQGRFAIGYYHQMQDFFTKKSDKKNE